MIVEGMDLDETLQKASGYFISKIQAQTTLNDLK